MQRPGVSLRGLAGAAGWAALIAFPAFALLVFGIDSEPRFVDESSFLAQSGYFDLFAAGEREHPAWLAFPAFDQPPLMKYLVGLTLRAEGYRRPPLSAATAWHHDNDLKIGTPAMLRAARWPSASLGAAGCVAVFALGRMAGGLRVGILAALLLAVNPLYRQQAHRAVGDVPCEALVLASAALGLWAWRETLAGRLGGWTVMSAAATSGVLAGLAALAKLSGALAVIVAGGWMVLALALGRYGPRRRLAASAIGPVAGVLAVATFVALNPTITARPPGVDTPAARGGPVSRAVTMAGLRAELSAEQQRGEPIYALRTPWRKIETTAVQGYGRFGPFGPRWSHPPVLHDWAQDRWGLVWGPWVALGAVWAAARGRRQYLGGEPPSAWAVLLLAAVSLAAVVAYVPMAWDRYFLPIQAGSALLAAGAAVAAWDLLTRRVIARTPS